MGTQRRRVGMGLLFYPRGGSAQVARYLSRALVEAGWEVALASGSLGSPGEDSHAATFYAGLGVTVADFTPALAAHLRGDDPMAASLPFHPSYEERPGAPDRPFAALAPELAEHQARAWERVLVRAGFGRADLLHLHHLTPLHDAAACRWPRLPLLTHLHGTELKMLDRIARLAAIAAALGTDLAGMAARAEAGRQPAGDRLGHEEQELLARTRWELWRFGEHWAARLRAAAGRSERLVCLSHHERDEAERLLGVPREAVEVIPNGVDPARFDRRRLSREERLALLRRWLVEEPRGWDESSQPGSVRYPPAALEAFVDRRSGRPLPLLLFVGRFLGLKRVPLLVRAYARARPRFRVAAPLLVWGGFPGEWEGEHPHTVAEREGVEGVFFSGWRGHEELPLGLACADVLVGPSTDEPFGQVFLEAMSCGLPVIATRSGGPPSFVNTVAGKPNGWLVSPDDVDALADSLVEAVNGETDRRARAENAYEQIRGRYSWRALASRFACLYEEILRQSSPGSGASAVRKPRSLS